MNMNADMYVCSYMGFENKHVCMHLSGWEVGSMLKICMILYTLVHTHGHPCRCFDAVTTSQKLDIWNTQGSTLLKFQTLNPEPPVNPKTNILNPARFKQSQEASLGRFSPAASQHITFP